MKDILWTTYMKTLLPPREAAVKCIPGKPGVPLEFIAIGENRDSNKIAVLLFKETQKITISWKLRKTKEN